MIFGEMSMNLVYDDIIYSLQKSGGGSVYWTEVIRPTLSTAKHYVYDNANQNIFYKQITMNNRIVLSSKLFLLKRFINPRHEIKEPHIFHSSYFRYSRDKSAVNITTVHDFTVEKFGRGLHARAHIIQQKMAVKNSRGVICVSENTKKDFLEYYPWYKGRVVAIPNGYDETTYYYEQGVNKTKDVLFVGARTNYKRFDIAVKIVSKIPECRLVIIGGGNLTDDEKRIVEAELHGRYEKKGFITNEELRHLYNSAFFLCYPSEYEGFGIPLLEAQACGCPVLCQNKSSIPEVVQESAIYIESSDLEKAVVSAKLLFDETVYSDYVSRGLENVKRYSWTKSANSHQQFYKEMWEEYCK